MAEGPTKKQIVAEFRRIFEEGGVTWTPALQDSAERSADWVLAFRANPEVAAKVTMQ